MTLRLAEVASPAHIRDRSSPGELRRRRTGRVARLDPRLPRDRLAPRNSPHNKQRANRLYLPQHRQHKVLNLTVSRICDNEEEGGGGVEEGGLDEHGGDGGVCARVVRGEDGARAAADEVELGDDEGGDEDVEGGGDRPVGDAEVDGRLGPEVCVWLGQLEEEYAAHC